MDLPGSGLESGWMNGQQASLKQLRLDTGMEEAMKELSTRLREMGELSVSFNPPGDVLR